MRGFIRSKRWSVSVGATMAGALILATSTFTAATPVLASSSTLWPGQNLYPGWSISSTDGNYQLLLQNQMGYAGDLYGNLVLYAPGGRALWSTTIWNSSYEGAPFQFKQTVNAAMQSDGNFVLYYDACGCGGWVALWASGTSGHPNSRLVMQTDGNLVIYSPSGQALWNTATYRPSAAYPPGTYASRPWGSINRIGSNSCLDDSNWSIAWGNRMQLWSCAGSSNTNQQWRELVGPIGDPTIVLQNLTSGLCLDVSGNNSANFTPAIQWGCNYADSAQTLNISGTGNYASWYLQAAGTHTCLDDPYQVLNNGTQLEFYQCNNTAAQVWTASQVGGGMSSPPMVPPIDMLPIW